MNVALSFPKAPPHAPRVRAGYTFVELMVVILVCSILMAAALPRYANAVLQYRVDAAAKRVAADVAFAQRQAVTRSTSQIIIFTTATGSPTPSSYSMPAVRYVDFAAAGSVVKLAEDPYRSSIVSATFGAGTILTFDRYGNPTSGGSVVVQAGSYSKTISVDATTGRATIL